MKLTDEEMNISNVEEFTCSCGNEVCKFKGDTSRAKCPKCQREEELEDQ